MTMRAPISTIFLCSLVTILWSFPVASIAQIPRSRTERLYDRLQEERSDTGRVRLLIAYGMALSADRGDTSGLPFIHESVAIAERIHDPRGLACKRLPDAIRHDAGGEYEKAIEDFKDCIARLDEGRITQDLYMPLGDIRNCYTSAGLQEERYQFYVEAIDRYRSIGLEQNLAVSHHGLGGYYLINRQYAQAIEHYMRAWNTFRMTDPDAAANEALVLGLTYSAWGNLDKAEQYLNEGVRLNLEQAAYPSVIRGISALGEVQLQRGDTLEATASFRSMLTYPDRIGDFEKALANALLVQVHVWTGKLDSARIFLDSLDILLARTPFPVSSSSGDCEVDYCHYLYELALGHEERADEYLQAALIAAHTVRSQSLILKYRKELARRYRDKGDYEMAAMLQHDYIRMKDSLQALADLGAVAGYEGQMKSQEDALEIERQRAQLARGKLMVLAVTVIALLLAVLVFIIVRSNRRKQRVNKELDKARLRAENSERSKQQFLANMSHEIRTPMNAIMGMTGILKRNEHLPEQNKYLNAISQSSENLLVILNDILDLSKLEAGRIELEKVPFNVRSVITNIQEIMRFKAEEKGLAVEVSIDEAVPRMLLGDPTRLHQILLNLVGNAVKFTDHGSVMIRVDPDPDPDQVDPNRPTDPFDHHTELIINVTDTGIGIPEDRLDKIFEEFTQAYSDTTRKYGGTGLGLTISKRLAEVQGGSIKVQSERDIGSTFTVRIPYAIADAVYAPLAPGQRGSESAERELHDLRILLAEDNEFNVMVAQDELADAFPGVQVAVAANGRIAVAMASANTYDVILMDVQMPEMNGYDATKAIKALDGDISTIPIIAMTANVMTDELERCREAGMNGHIPKPFTREQLVKAITTAVNK